jgi:hypothetical protein
MLAISKEQKDDKSAEKEGKKNLPGPIMDRKES